MSSTVQMVRDGKPADVHPLEVDRWSAAGWVRVGGAPDVPEEPSEPAAEAEEPEVEADAEASVELARFSVHKIVDGEPNERASRAELTRAEAEAYVAARPQHQYDIVQDDD